MSRVGLPWSVRGWADFVCFRAGLLRCCVSRVSSGRSRQTCYNIKTLGFEVARQKAIEERYRQMEASAYANGGSHKQQQLTNGSTGGNAPKTSASSELSKEQCAQSLPPSSAMGAGHWPRHRSQEGGSSTLGSAYGVAEDINNGCSSNNLPETSSLQGALNGAPVPPSVACNRLCPKC